MRGKTAVLCIVALVALAGCLHGGSSASGEPIENVPSQADFLMKIDGGIIEDPTTEQLVDASIERNMENDPNYDGPESYDEWLEELRSETEVDPTSFGKGVAFGEVPDTSEMMTVQPPGEEGETEEYFGFVFKADWTEDQMVESIEENASVSTQEYSGTTIYVIEPETQDTEFGSGTQDTAYAAALPDGTFVFGTEGAVQDTIDVANGDSEAVGGELREEFDRVRDGYITFTATVPDTDMGGGAEGGPAMGPGGGAAGFSSFNNITVASGAYYTSGEDTVGMTVNLRTDSGEDAQNIRDGINGMVQLASMSGGQFSDMLDPLEINIEDTTVVADYEVTVDELTQMLKDLEGFGQQQPGGEFGGGGGDFGGGGSGGSGSGDFGSGSDGGSFDEGDFESEFGSNSSSSSFRESSP